MKLDASNDQGYWCKDTADLKKFNVSTNSCQLVKFQIGIQDFGAGIPQDQIDKLFGDFGVLEHNRDRNQQGRGLGFSICRNIIKKMGGRVTVSSELDQGTTFMIDLVMISKQSEDKSMKRPEKSAA